MRKVFREIAVLIIVFLVVMCAAYGQVGNSGSLEGTVKDSSGGAIPGASVEIRYGVSGFSRTTTTGPDGTFRFTNVPFNPYHLTVTAEGFKAFAQDVEVRSAVAVSLEVAMQVGSQATTVTVESSGGGLVENDSTFHTDVDRGLFNNVPLESSSSSVSSLVTLASPGVAADSNGLFHGLGDHAQNSFSVDGQPITDQQSKVFSNQIPMDSIASLEVIEGAPPAEYGDKTSLVIDVTTRSGLGITPPHGDVTGSYGSFGTPNLDFDFAYGGQKWGNFIAANGMRTSRFLDPPEFAVFHDKGNQENIFDRFDYQLSNANSVHLNLNFSRSWFQTPNSYDAQLATGWNGLIADNNGLDPNGNPVGPADQRSQ